MDKTTSGKIYGGVANISYTTGGTAFTFGVPGKELGAMNAEHCTTTVEDGERVVACWNALDGLTTEEIKVLTQRGGVKHLLETRKPCWVVEVWKENMLAERVGPFDCKGIAEMCARQTLEPLMPGAMLCIVEVMDPSTY
jgi:hypothetical protein